MSHNIRLSQSTSMIRRAAQNRDESKRPWCSTCGARCEPPGAERPHDWHEKNGHRNPQGDPCAGVWLVLPENVLPMRSKR